MREERKDDRVTTPIIKLTISVAQGLLLLIDKNKDNPRNLSELKELYLLGATDKDKLAKINQWLKDDCLNPYIIDRSPKAINDDPTRRYFESQLAYETLQSSVSSLHLDALKVHRANLFGLIHQQKPNWYPYILRTINGEIKSDEKIDRMYHEYSDAINRIQSDRQYQELSPDDREKISLIVQLSFLGTIVLRCGTYNTTLPIAIYGKDLYSQQKRGLVLKADNMEVKSHHLGLMTSLMPLSKNDSLFANNPAQALRPTDGSTYNIDAEWPRTNFESLVNPFACSISGTMLCQLRVMKYLTDTKENHLPLSESFIKCFTSTMLFCSGGHSFREFLTPLSLPEVKDAFPEVENFSVLNMLLTSNIPAFSRALDNTIKYNKIIIERAAVLESIENPPLDIHKKQEIKTLKTPAEMIDALEREISRYAQEIVTGLLESSEVDLQSNLDKANQLSKFLRLETVVDLGITRGLVNKLREVAPNDGSKLGRIIDEFTKLAEPYIDPLERHGRATRPSGKLG